MESAIYGSNFTMSCAHHGEVVQYNQFKQAEICFCCGEAMSINFELKARQMALFGVWCLVWAFSIACLYLLVSRPDIIDGLAGSF